MMFTGNCLLYLHSKISTLLRKEQQQQQHSMSDNNTDSSLVIHEIFDQSQSAINCKDQIPSSIRNFSSQYGSHRTESYVVSNICSGIEIYPHYGDSQRALVFRTYGPWWINTPSHQYSIKHFTRFEPSFTSRDYVDIEYKHPVYIDSLHLYETYNPGTLEVVYAGFEEKSHVKWFRIWKFPEPFKIEITDSEENCDEFSIINGLQSFEDIFHDRQDILMSSKKNMSGNECELAQISKLHTRHRYPSASRQPRIVKIQLADRIKFPCKLIRLEFDHSTVGYYTEIDTVILIGRPVSTLKDTEEQTNKPPLLELCDIIPKQLTDDATITPTTETNEECISNLGLIRLPFDILFTICTYLDLRSLIRLSSTCRYLYDKCLHPLQFQALNLQPYWYGITNYSIDYFFSLKCTQTKYLSLAWTKSINLQSFTLLLNTQKLIQLNLACCQYMNDEYIDIISKHCQQLEIINLENCYNLTSDDFIPLKNLKNLKSINFYRTKIDHRTLIPLVKNNYLHLEYVNLGACQQLTETDYVIKLIFSKCKRLKTLDLWRAHSLSQNGFHSIIGEQLKVDVMNDDKDIMNELLNDYLTASICYLEHLKELDFGWCDIPPDFIKKFVKNCGKSLMKLFLTACRRITNDDMIAISEYCPELKQLDILGSRIINEQSIELILKKCTKLEFLDLSFCDKIESQTIDTWKEIYGHCKSFKRSYPPRVPINNICTEFP